MPDDDLIDLMQTPKIPESGPDKTEPDPERRSTLAAWLIAIALVIAIGWLFEHLEARPGGTQFAAMTAYTVAILYISSNRFLKPVPWARFNLFRERFLLVHWLALAIVYGIITGALAIKPRLPIWFVSEGQKGSLFQLCLFVILVILALYESFWMSGYADRKDTDADQG